jgi:hypothetical protein
MKYIEKSRLETFLKFKGYKSESNYSEGEQNKNTCWQKSEKEKVTVPSRDVFPSDALAEIFSDKDLLNEFRKF